MSSDIGLRKGEIFYVFVLLFRFLECIYYVFSSFSLLIHFSTTVMMPDMNVRHKVSGAKSTPRFVCVDQVKLEEKYEFLATRIFR